MIGKGRVARLVDGLQTWIAPRWDGLEKGSAFLSKPLPRNVSWLHTLGGLLLAYILFQIFTGVLLGLYYSPGPESAYESVQYIQNELFLGRFLHHLHRYGSAFIIVTAFLHLARSYFFAAYKAPRELLWITGLMLFILLTLFAFTGQLLPFDQRGYWATVVGIQIASSAPGVGDLVRDLLTGGYGDIGAATLSRFYIMHVSLFPIALLGLIGLHLGILQRTGSAGPMNPDVGVQSTRPFFPSQAMKDVLVAAGGAFALCLVAALVTSSETGPADPTSGSYIPRPEWYFLSHYLILKYLPGNLLIVGTFVLPNIILAALFALPFIDRNPHRSFRRRKFAVTIGAVGFASVIILTAIGILDEAGVSETTETETAALSPVDRGRAYFFHDESCSTCHTIDRVGGTQGPDLTHVTERLRPDYLPRWIRNPSALKPDTEMPGFEGTDDELEDVVQFLLTLE